MNQYQNSSQDLSTEASDIFERALLEDKVQIPNTTDTSVIQAVGLTGQGLIGLDTPFGKQQYFKNLQDHPLAMPWYGSLTESTSVALRPWRGTLKNRLNRQTDDFRKRLSNPKALILAVQGTNYSAENIDDLLDLYFKAHPKSVVIIHKSFWVRLKNKVMFWRSK